MSDRMQIARLLARLAFSVVAFVGGTVLVVGLMRTLSPEARPPRPAPLVSKPEATPAAAPDGHTMTAARAKPAAALTIVFKLDPRITRGLYMGDRWASPAVFTQVGEGPGCVVEARARGLDGRGQPVAGSPRWTSADPGIASVSPRPGGITAIAVHRAGTTHVQVSFQGTSKVLTISAVNYRGTLKVAVSQQG